MFRGGLDTPRETIYGEGLSEAGLFLSGRADFLGLGLPAPENRFVWFWLWAWRDKGLDTPPARQSFPFRCGSSNNGLSLVEVSPNAGGDSVGQLLVYKALWELEHPDQPSPNLLLVSGFERSDIREVSRVAGVELLVV